MIGAMPSLSRADVEHVAHLARLGLTGEELARLEGQLNHILDQYAVLAELDTDASRRPPRRSSWRTSSARTSRARRCRRGCRPCERPGARRRILRRARDPRRRAGGRGGPVTDLTRLFAHEMAARLRGRRGHLPRADGGPPGPRRAHGPCAPRLAHDRPGAGPGEADAADARLDAARAEGDGALDALHPLSASRSRSRTSCPWPAASARRAPASSRATAPRTTRTSRSACATPAP
jgi:Asp-tRNA(Asn)/Glu-tRNA(Gln) amidotransferase C subunit